jgi:hypothetical protein
MTVKIPQACIDPATGQLQPVPNPLHNFASYTYALSLWWLDINDYTALATAIDVDDALANTFPNSYVVAEDSGLFPDQRLPTMGGLNYNLSNLRLVTHVQPGIQNGQSDLLHANFTITEPYGSTFINALLSQSIAIGQANYLEQHYLLQVDFFGYDDTGAQIPKNQTSLFRKRFPIRITEIKVKLTNAGSVYEIKATPVGFEIKNSINCKIPTAMQVTATTFKELLTGVAKKYNDFYANEVALGHRQLADTLQFNIDPSIGASVLSRPDTMPLSQTNPNSADSTLGGVPFNFTKDEDLMSIVQKAFSQCSFWVDDQIGLGNLNTNISQTNLGVISNTYKTTFSATPAGLAGNGSMCTAENSQDLIRNKQAYSYGVNIHQYSTYGGPHPLDPGPLADTRPHTVKLYNYVYTGENIDIKRLDVDFNCRYYTAVITGANQINAAQVTSDSANQNKATYAKSSGFALTPNLLINTILPQFKNTPILAPVRVQSIINDASVSSGLRGQSDAIVAADVLAAKQEAGSADMLTVKLEIVGDPTLLKQDNWLYTPNPNTSSNYNSWETMGNYEFYLKYGHIRMDVGQLIVGLQIDTPIDIDTDYLNNGLVFPPMSRNGTASSVFSGQYAITTISSTFDKGEFTQKLSLARIFNQELVTQTPIATPNKDASTKSQADQRESSTTNGNLPAVVPVQNTVANPFATSGIQTSDLNNSSMYITPSNSLNNSTANTNGVGVQARQ